VHIVNKNILISGASSGIGEELAMQLAAKGNRLFLLARRESLLSDLLQKLTAHPLGHRYYVCDVSDRSQVQEVCGRILAEQISMDILILNAGVGGGFAGLNMDLDSMRYQFDVNFWGVVYPLAWLLPGMAERKSGLVAVMSSLAGYRGLPGSAPYSASKAALRNLVESLRIDLYDSGLRFSLISPGFVKTPMTDRNAFPMPFMVSVEKAAQVIIRGLEKEKTEIHFPYRLSFLVKALRWMPDSWYAFLLKKRTISV
jgi:short-subunit dehydrogenase